MIFFLHIPSTGGSTMMSVLRQNYPEEAIGFLPRAMPLSGFRRFVIDQRDAMSSLQVVVSTIPYTFVRLLPNAKCFTLLRSPLDRVHAYFDYLRRTPGKANKHWCELHELALKGDLYAYLMSGRDVEVNDWQTRLLSGKGALVPFGHTDEDMLEVAKDNLEKGFCAVGLTERFDESLHIFSDKFGWENTDYVRVNVSNPEDHRRRQELGPETKTLLQQLNSLDQRLYEWTETRFLQQLSSSMHSGG